MTFRIAICVAAVALSACAGDPLVVKASGTLPASGSFATAGQQAESPYLPLLLDRLEGRGLSRSAEPDYLVQLATSTRPRRSGLFVPEESPEWLRSPARGGGEVPTLVFTVSERTSGRELYRASVTARRRHAADDPERLIEAVFPDEIGG